MLYSGQKEKIMGRKLMRVPLDFDWPHGKIWPGYMVSFETRLEQYYPELPYEEREKLELQFGKIMGCPIKTFGTSQYVEWTFLEPPTGEGYQLWETTSEGSPQSPVFKTFDELCEWCADNATTFASYTATASEWKQMLEDGIVSHQEGNVIFM
jgi:hypothetical protein